MKKRIITLVLALTLVLTMTGCGKKTEIKEIDKYFYEVETYTFLDYDFVNEYFADKNDNWGGGCTAVSAIIDGTRLVGRNMDLNISNKCAYLIRTQVPGKYETFGLAYTFRDMSPDYEDVKKHGIDETFSAILPFMCDDVVNSEGLHIEINMRHGEKDAQGNDLFSVEHTNENAPLRAYVFNLGQYVALNCKDLDDVKRYLEQDIDVYSQKGYWNYCFVITDANGDSALLEFGNNRYYWVEPDDNGVVAQANFYVNEECNKMEDIKTGLGRYDVIMENIGKVTNRQELFELMKRIQYSSFYLPYAECKTEHFDPRSEGIGEVEGLTYELAMDPDNEIYVEMILDLLNDSYRPLTRQEKQDMNSLWESTFTEVVVPSERTVFVRLFENDSNLYRVSFDGVEKISEIA